MLSHRIGRLGLLGVALSVAVAIGWGLAGLRGPSPPVGSAPETPLGDPLQYGLFDKDSPYATVIYGGDVIKIKFPDWVAATMDVAREATRRAVETPAPSIVVVPTPTSRYPLPLSEADAIDWLLSSLPPERAAAVRDPIARRISAAKARELFGGDESVPPADLVWVVAAKLDPPNPSYPGPYRVMVTGVGVDTGSDVMGLFIDEAESQRRYEAIAALENE